MRLTRIICLNICVMCLQACSSLSHVTEDPVAFTVSQVPAVASRAQEVSATWKNLRAGDCQIDTGTLTLRSDGTGHWSAVVFTYSTHSGDYWHAGWEILDKDGVRVTTLPGQTGPRMDDGNGGPSPKYHWEVDFKFDASQFAKMASVRMYNAC